MMTADQLERALDATRAHREQVQVFTYHSAVDVVGGTASIWDKTRYVVRDLTLTDEQEVFSYRAHPADYDEAHVAAMSFAERYKLRLITEYINAND